jgi:hypothetical protein
LRHLAQAGDHNDVLADAFDPPMEGDNAIAVVDMEDVDLPPAKRRQLSVQDDSSRVKRKWSLIALSAPSPSHQMWKSLRSGESLHILSSRNSCPMNSIGTPGPVKSRPVATRDRLRAYHDLGLFQSAIFAIRGRWSCGA